MEEYIYLKVPTKHFTTADIVQFASSKKMKLKWRPNDNDACIITLTPEATDPIKTLLKIMESK